jgi:hypothetical protein
VAFRRKIYKYFVYIFATVMAKQASTSSYEKPSSLEARVEALVRENNELKAKIAQGPTDETWFTPGLMGLLALGLFGALWARYEPVFRHRSTPTVQTPPADEYNPR